MNLDQARQNRSHMVHTAQHFATDYLLRLLNRST